VERSPSSSGDNVWKTRFNTLANLFNSLSWTMDPDQFYQGIAQALLEYSDYDAATIRLYTVTECKVIGCAFKNPDDKRLLLKDFLRTPIGVGRMAEMMQSREPFVIRFNEPSEQDNPVYMKEVAQAGYDCALVLQIFEEDEVIGDTVFASRTPREFDGDSLHYMQGIVPLVSYLVNAAEYSHRSLEARILEERQHLGIEILDNVSHLVTGARLQAEQALTSYWAQDSESLERELMLLEKMSNEAVNALRDEVVTLKRVPNETADFVSDVHHVLRRFEHMWKIKTHLKVMNGENIKLDTSVELQGMHVIHEALSNVYRHARAKNLNVEIERENHVVFIRIIDDGCGFDTKSVPPEKMGLRVMRERIELVGGDLAIDSKPGAGTSVLIALPE
jgi:signal transduction histidine kinase